MPEVSFDEAWRQIERLRSVGAEAEREGRWEDAEAALRGLLTHPCAHHLVVEHEVLDDIHHVWRRAGRWDDAITAKRDAITAGYRSTPDPEADIAECLVLTEPGEIGVAGEVDHVGVAETVELRASSKPRLRSDAPGR